MNPKLEAGIELKVVTDTLTYAEEKEFTNSFTVWCDKWDSWLMNQKVLVNMVI